MVRSRIAREKARNILSMFLIKDAPVDVNKIANMLGFRVILFDFPDELSGVVKTIGKIKAIGVNKKHSEVRQRFTIAHELGHYLSGHENVSHDISGPSEGDKKYLDKAWRQEEEADEFAAELLMPESILKKDAISGKVDPKLLAEKYRTSEQAMIIQLVNLKLLT